VVTVGLPTASDGRRGNVERMARAGSISLAGAGVAAVAGVALMALITNNFDKATAGRILTATSLFLIATAVVQLGTDIGLVRWIPTLIVRGHGHLVRPVVRVALVPVLGASVLVALLGFLFSSELAGIIDHTDDGGQLASEIQVLSLFLPVASAYNTVLAATRGFRTQVPTAVTESFGRALLQLACVGGALLFGLGAVSVVMAWSLPYAVALVVAITWFRVLLQRRVPLDDVPRDGATAEESGRAFWRYTAPRAIGTASQVALKRSDIILVAALRSPRDAALYAAATRFVVLGQLGVQALQQALSPQLSALFAQDDNRSVREVYRATTAWAMLLAWPVYLACAVLAPDLLKIFGPGYSQVAPVVVLLSIAMLAATACGAVDTVLLMSGHSWLSLGNNLFALGLNVGLNLVLIPQYGALGAGISWTVSIIVRNLLPLVQIAWKYHISPLGRETALVAGISIATLGVVPGLLRILSVPTVVVLASLLLGGLVFLALVWRFREALQLGVFATIVKRSRDGRRAA
jgi:O-antigen/teichoic acid export membrane protein